MDRLEDLVGRKHTITLYVPEVFNSDCSEGAFAPVSDLEFTKDGRWKAIQGAPNDWNYAIRYIPRMGKELPVYLGVAYEDGVVTLHQGAKEYLERTVIQ